MKEIMQIATIMLGSDFPEFQKLSALLDSDPGHFEESGLVEAYALDDWWNDGVVDLSLLLYAFADKHGYLLTVDWTGEEEPGDLETFIQKRLIALGTPQTFSNLIEAWEQTLNWDDLERGDYIIEKIKYVDSELQKNGYAIAIYELGWDSYSIFLVKKSDFETLCQSKVEGEFSVFGADDL